MGSSEFEIKKPERIFVEGIGWVKEGEVVKVPEHQIKLTIDGDGPDVICPSKEGRVYFEGGIPHYVAVVECLNANNLEAKVQCPKKWKSE